MKKTLILFAAALFSAAAFVSCVEDDEVEVPTGVVSTETKYYDFSAEYNGQTIYFRIDTTATNECYVTHGNTSTAPIYDEETGYNHYAFYQGAVNIPAQVIYNGTTYNVTGIGRGAFEFTKLTDVTIPSTVTSIGDYAFRYTKLTDVSIPSSVTSIGNWAFGRTKLTDVTIPSSVTSIGGYAFYSTRLSSVTIPSTVKHIGEGAFSYCRNLTDLRVESGNTEYMAEDNILYTKNKSALLTYAGGKTGSEFTVESTIDSISYRAFDGNNNLVSVVIESNIDYLSEAMFDGCKNFASIEVAGSNDYYTTQDGVLYNKDKTILLFYPQAKTGESFTVPNTVTTINKWAFEACSALNSVEMQKGLKTISSSAFNSATSLEEVVIPASVDSIGGSAFYGCKNLTTVTSYVQEPFEISDYVFKIDNNTYTTATLYVPAGTEEKYRNTQGWKNFANYETLK